MLLLPAPDESLAGLQEGAADAFLAIERGLDVAQNSPSREAGVSTAKTIDDYVRRFDADRVETWQPIFSRLWRGFRRPPANLGTAQAILWVDARARFLHALASTAESSPLRALTLYVFVENRLVYERELGTLSAEARKEAVAAAITLRKEFGDLLRPKRNSPAWDEPYRHFARGQQTELERLHIGAIAPDIEEKNLEGEVLKLSDYRGQVVVLSFWGAWCGPCIARVPDERALVARMQGMPFRLLGINTDPELATAKTAVEEHDITWQSFWNGPEGWRGNIASRWFVQGYPIYYVLDHEGRIRFKKRSWEGLEAVVDSLVGADL
jgi:thiol-disulfide isomerase/thioredoxin